MDNPTVKKKDKPSAKAGGQDVDLTPHPLVSKLMPDSENAPDVVVLEGYLGPSKREGSVRLYLDLAFRSCFEIPRSGIIHAEPADPSNESKPTKLVVDPSTKLDLIYTLEASYLKGTIASAHSDGAGNLDFASPRRICIGTGIPVTKLPCTVIISVIHLCQSLSGICQ
ncbi:MAG: hypothetical protein ACHRXM_28605 [Isosphaerales bacterium]